MHQRPHRRSAARLCALLLALGLPLATGGIPAAAAPRSITFADNNQTIDLALGEQFVLALGAGYAWAVSVADPAVIAPLPDAPVGADEQGRYAARHPGATTLTATGEPACRQSRPPCGLPTRLFTLQVRVAATPPLPGLPATGDGTAGPSRTRPPLAPLLLATLLGLVWCARRVRHRRAAP